MGNIVTSWWSAYEEYIDKIVLPPDHGRVKDITHWRNAAFSRLLAYIAPIVLITLIPSLYVAYLGGYVVVGIADIIAFVLLIFMIINRRMTIIQRKNMFLLIFYTLSMLLMCDKATAGVGMLYLLGLTILSGVLLSPEASYYAASANALICMVIGGILYFTSLLPDNDAYRIKAWIGESANFVLLSFACAKGLVLLLRGLQLNMEAKSEAEMESILSTNRLTLATRTAQIGIWEWNIALDHLSWDEGMHKIYNRSDAPKQLIYHLWLSMIHPEDKNRVNLDMQMAISGEKKYDTEFRIVWPDGSIHSIRATGTVERDDAGVALAMIGANWDVTIRKEEMHRLRVSEANVKAVIDNADAVIYSLDKEWRYISFNEVQRMYIKRNFNIDIHQGDKIFDFLENSAHQEWLEWSRIYTQAMAGAALRFEKEFRIDGITTTTSFSVNPIIENDEVIGLACVGVDITEIKKARIDLEEMNRSLEEKVAERTTELANANKELEAFSYSVSHDLRAPVSALIGFGQIIKNEHADSLDDDVKEMFSYMEKSARRMDDIISDLLILAKYGKEKLVYSDVNLNTLFSDTWDSLLFTSPHHATLDLQPMPVVYADRSMLQQVIVNMLSNAVKYSSKKDHPVITVGYSNTSESFTIYIKDNGAGFDMKHYDRLFGAFQRLHGETEFEGTGVGLMLTKKIIDRHGGTVWADGKVGDGATFYFSLPTAA